MSECRLRSAQQQADHHARKADAREGSQIYPTSPPFPNHLELTPFQEPWHCAGIVPAATLAILDIHMGCLAAATNAVRYFAVQCHICGGQQLLQDERHVPR